MITVIAAALGLAIVSLILYFRWKWITWETKPVEEPIEEYTNQTQVIHHLCPHHKVAQRGYELEEKDSLDEHLDILTKKLADKEGRLRLSKSKIRETQNEIKNLHAIDFDVKTRYQEIMESLRSDLLNNEKDCKKLQEQIEWVSQRRAELKDEDSAGILRFAANIMEILNQEVDVILQDCQSQQRPDNLWRGSGRVSKKSSDNAKRKSPGSEDHGETEPAKFPIPALP